MHETVLGKAQAARELAAAQAERSVAALRDLIQIPSLTGEEGRAQAHVAALLRAIGAEVQMLEPNVEAMFRRFPQVAQYPTHWQHDLILPYEDLPTFEALKRSGLEGVLNYKGRPNVVGVLKGSGGGRSLILNAHVDTVTIEPKERWTRDPFGGEVIDGRMYGRGTSDMKGGLMAGVMALTYLREAGVRLRGDVILQCVVNEEHAGNGTLDLVTRGVTADAAIVLEPTHNTIAVSNPGGLYWQVTINGVPRSPGARWSGDRQDGVSAIEKLPAIVTALLDLERAYNRQTVMDPEEVGRAPFALVIGKVAGGHYETVTASALVLKGGAYFAPSVGDVREVMNAFRVAIQRANDSDPYLRENPARLEFLHHDDSARQSPALEIARHMGAVLARAGGDGSVHPGPFCCDMRHLVNQGGIPSIIFGPGTIAQAHQPDEYIVVSDYLTAVDHLIAFIVDWCNYAPAGKADSRT